jgi:hypothetical protein
VNFPWWCLSATPNPAKSHISELITTGSGGIPSATPLDDTGAPVGVQQKLMRHAQVSTTMNVYGNDLMGAKREANSNVVRMALRSA